MDDKGAFLATTLLGAKVVDSNGTNHGALSDLAASWSGGDDLPVVTHGVIRIHGRTQVFTWENVHLGQREIKISTRVDEVTEEPGPILLRQHVLDHQLVDTQDMRVVRVSDIRLAYAPDASLVVLGVDPGQYAVIRRVLPELGRMPLRSALAGMNLRSYLGQMSNQPEGMEHQLFGYEQHGRGSVISIQPILPTSSNNFIHKNAMRSSTVCQLRRLQMPFQKLMMMFSAKSSSSLLRKRLRTF